MSEHLDAFIAALDAAGLTYKTEGQGYAFQCPVHDDTEPSAHVEEGRTQPVVAVCHGCGASYTELAEALGVDVAIGATEYEYRNAEGRVVALRTRRGTGKGKRMTWAGPDGTGGRPADATVPYRLPELVAAPADAPVYIVEGEKDVETLRHWGFVATTPGGANDPWRPEWNRYIAGHPVVFLPDNDDPGREFAQRVAGSLDSIPSVKIVMLPVTETGADVTDWARDGGTPAALRLMVDREPEWDPLEAAAETVVLEDAQLAERWVTWTAHRVHYVEEENPNGRAWLWWDGARWVRRGRHWAQAQVFEFGDWFAGRAATEPRSKVRRDMQAAARKLYKVSTARAVLDAALGVDGVMVSANDLDQNPHLLGVQNGVVDLRSGRLLDADPARIITKTAAAPWLITAQAPTWRAFLERIFEGDPDLIGYVQRAVGYTLTGHQTEQAFFVLHGDGANGKSKFVGALQHVLGDYAGTAATTTLMAVRERGVGEDIHALMGARLVAATETQQGRQIDVARMKWLTGGDTVTSRPLYGKPVTYIPTYKLWLATNHLPVADSTDSAYWRRVRLIPFRVKFREEEQDKRLLEKLTAEAAGILAWAVEGAVAWYRQGLQEPDTVIEATKAYRSEMDLVGAFLSETTVEDAEARVALRDLHRAFVEWYAEAAPQRTPLTMRAFGVDLEARGYPPARGSKGIAIRRGLRLLAPNHR